MLRLFGALLITLLAVFVLLGTPAVGTVIIDNGMINEINASNSFPAESVSVRGEGTIVNVVDGGQIGTLIPGDLLANGGTEVNVFGGVIGNNLIARSTAVVHVSGGSIGDPAFSPNIPGIIVNSASAAVRVSGGTINGGKVIGSSRITISGGVFTETFRYESIAANHLFGGEFTKGIELFGGLLLISGGSIDSLDVHTSTAVITGGEIMNDLTASGRSLTRIHGGDMGSLVASEDSEIQIIGAGFNFPYGEISVNSGTLTGTLLDGTPINSAFGKATTAKIVLASTPIPEPATAILLLFGMACATLSRK